MPKVEGTTSDCTRERGRATHNTTSRFVMVMMISGCSKPTKRLLVLRFWILDRLVCLLLLRYLSNPRNP